MCCETINKSLTAVMLVLRSFEALEQVMLLSQKKSRSRSKVNTKTILKIRITTESRSLSADEEKATEQSKKLTFILSF